MHIEESMEIKKDEQENIFLRVGEIINHEKNINGY